ncbi:MAG: OmpA family protein [Bacteroidales bacterium]|nr:OmpA family protein [Bacteroidales bacterium]
MKNLFLLASLFLIFAFNSITAQKDENQVNFYDGEFFLAEEFYRDALLAYKKVYDAGFQENANINYRIGICYLNLPGEKSEAIPYFEKAVTQITASYKEGNFKEVSAPIDAWLFLGNAYRISYQLDNSIEAYNKFIELHKNPNSKETFFALNQIEACHRAKEAIKNPVEMKIENIGGLYNSNMNNFNTVMSSDGSAMAYMSEQRFYDAAFYVAIENGRFTTPINITPQIESDGDQYVTGLNSDGTKMLLTKISAFDADIMISNYEARRWQKSQNIGKPINSKFFESHACFSPDENTIYFTSNRKESLGGMDIFYSQKGPDGKWSEPVNAGETINTPLNEESPFMCSDGKTLYFSSQGHSTSGGYDIFVTQLQEDGSWTEPEALPYPFNTTDDDIFFYPLCDHNAGYMTRFEPDGFGSGDIYKVGMVTLEEMAEETLEEAIEETEAAEEVTETVPEGFILEETEILPVEEQTRLPERAYRIKPVFFEFDSYALSQMAMDRLDEIAEVMNTFQEIKIEIQGHTDSKGPDSYNQILSERRAGAVRKYLLEKGIDPNRLTAKGYSESVPVAINQNPDGTDSFKGRKLNRRVEFKIDPGIQDYLEIEPVEVPDDLKLD